MCYVIICLDFGSHTHHSGQMFLLASTPLKAFLVLGSIIPCCLGKSTVNTTRIRVLSGSSSNLVTINLARSCLRKRVLTVLYAPHLIYFLIGGFVSISWSLQLLSCLLPLLSPQLESFRGYLQCISGLHHTLQKGSLVPKPPALQPIAKFITLLLPVCESCIVEVLNLLCPMICTLLAQCLNI